MKKKWNEKVYGKEDKHTKPTEDFYKNQEECLRRDNFTCRRCEKRKPKKLLSAHHIKPRSQGGGDNIENLLTLCHPCHDFVEVNGLKTRTEIMASYEESEIDIPIERTEEKNDEGYHFKRPAWHRWVYGDGRRK